MISTSYAYELQNNDGVNCYLIMEVKKGCLGCEYFHKEVVDYADSEEEAIEIVNSMNAALQANWWTFLR